MIVLRLIVVEGWRRAPICISSVIFLIIVDNALSLCRVSLLMLRSLCLWTENNKNMVLKSRKDRNESRIILFALLFDLVTRSVVSFSLFEVRLVGTFGNNFLESKKIEKETNFSKLILWASKCEKNLWTRCFRTSRRRIHIQRMNQDPPSGQSSLNFFRRDDLVIEFFKVWQCSENSQTVPAI